MIELYVLVYISCGFHCPLVKLEDKPSMAVCELEKRHIEERMNPDRTIVFCTKIEYEKGKKI